MKSTSKAAKKKEGKKKINNKVFIYLVFPAIIITIAAIFLIKSEQSRPGQDALKTLELLSSSQTRYYIMDGDSVNIDKLRSIDLEQLKKENGIKSDVAIYFEDSDSRVKQVGGMNCFGSPKIEVNGESCKD